MNSSLFIYHPKGIARDVTGMIGQYCQGNQPDSIQVGVQWFT